MRQDDSGRRAVRHFSGPIHCARRGAPAIISVVEREHGAQRLRSIVWCSLRGDAQWCGEDCLASRDADDRPAPTLPA